MEQRKIGLARVAACALLYLLGLALVMLGAWMIASGALCLGGGEITGYELPYKWCVARVHGGITPVAVGVLAMFAALHESWL